jgi:hypothetical protein
MSGFFRPAAAKTSTTSAEAVLVEAGTGVVLREDPLERGVVALDRGHGVVDERADGRLLRVGLQEAPAGLLRHPEDVDGPVLVGVLRVGAALPVGQEPGVLLLERVGDVLEEDEAEDDVLVLGGVHVRPEGARRVPELLLEPEVRAGAVPRLLLRSRHAAPPVSGEISPRRAAEGGRRRGVPVRRATGLPRLETRRGRASTARGLQFPA